MVVIYRTTFKIIPVRAVSASRDYCFQRGLMRFVFLLIPCSSFSHLSAYRLGCSCGGHRPYYYGNSYGGQSVRPVAVP